MPFMVSPRVCDGNEILTEVSDWFEVSCPANHRALSPSATPGYCQKIIPVLGAKNGCLHFQCADQ